MSQNKALVVAVIFAVCAIVTDLLRIGELGPDPIIGYAAQIRTGAITDWWSPLFMYEAIGLKSLLACLGVDVRPTFPIKIMAGVAHLCVLTALTHWVCYLTKENKLYLNLGALVGFFMFVFAWWLPYYRFHGYIDLPFVATTLTTISCILCMGSRKQRVVVFSWVFFTIALLHVVLFRKNAILLLPLLFGAAFYVTFGSRVASWKIFFLSLFSCILFTGGVFFVNSVLLPAKHVYSVIPMMVSDLKSASILNGTHRDEIDYLQSKGLISSINEVNTICAEYWIENAHCVNAEEWASFRRHYCSKALSDPASLLVAKALQGVQFSTNGHVPHVVRNAVCFLFPSVEPSSPVWCNGRHYAQAPERCIVYLATLLSLVYLLKTRSWSTRIVRLGLICGGVALVYLMSFIPLTPTPDYRYHSLSMILGCTSCCCAVLHWHTRRQTNRHVKASHAADPVLYQK